MPASLPEIGSGQLVDLVYGQIEGPVFILGGGTLVGETDTETASPVDIDQVRVSQTRVPGVIPLAIQRRDGIVREGNLVLLAEFGPLLPADIQ